MKFGIVLLLLITVGCGKGFRASGTSDLSSFASECFADSTADACVFEKNPLVASGLSAFASAIGLNTNLSLYQGRAVVLTGLDSSGLLQNSSISVDTGYGERAFKQDSWKFEFAGDTGARAVQVHTYYWLNHTIEEMVRRTGIFHAKDMGLEVVVNASSTGWLPAQKTIYLEKSSGGNQLALDAGLSVHLLGHANLYYATNGASEDLSQDTNHRDCGVTGGPVFLKDCCTARQGCSRAIASGQADYLVALMFPRNTTVGESWVNRASGFKMCEMSRDLRLHANTTAQQAFDTCGASASGQVLNMGTLYASIWFEIRQQVPDGQVADFDKLYMRHLSEVRGADTFATLLVKIKALDAAEFGGAFSSRFDSEYARRGI